MVGPTQKIRQALRWIVLGLALLGLPCLHAYSEQVGTIDLRQGNNLKMIFDGGLRPYRLQGLESQSCVFDEAALTVILPNTSSFQFHANRASIHVLAENEIDVIDLFGEDTTVPEAANLVREICTAWKLPTTGLDESIAHLGTMPDVGKGWGTELDQPDIRANVILKPLYYPSSVGAYVNITFHLGKHPHGMNFLTKPIQPPSGYEKVSMDPPPFKPSNPPVPAISFDEARAKVQAKLKEELGTNQTLPPQPPPQPAPASAVAPAEKKETSPWPVVLVVIAAVASLFFWIRHRRK
jgi:hypothetical protein